MKKWIKLTAVILFVVMGGAGCMSSESKVMEHLEEKYGEKFEIESIKEGSVIFPEMYGKDKVIAFPDGKSELVFLAGESRSKDDVYYDTYPLSKWSAELDKKYKDKILEQFGKEIEYKTIVSAERDTYDSIKGNISFDEFMQKGIENVDVTIDIAVKTAGEPNVEEYYEPVYNLLNMLKEENTEYYGIAVGFVDESEDISDYIRTANVNNLPWSNLDAKVYGAILVDNLREINSPQDIADYYEKFEE
ncbi:hypothetical protein J7E38_06600 [Bacillus sp. ISL-35]|uniref:hypothetical protein n=1 Tax=Bacillus sp. ISL-35 TaxID=2819122 RepID=UPI001BE86C0C|nr:hypothetical protein [Bacillus sp. ISL-35]MBT2678667.1 hypothetical protein [Bacillus sp. ISL-35]MBT2703659.1 hypothetical protein [Chryseobacterium sp. ISL-80]